MFNFFSSTFMIFCLHIQLIYLQFVFGMLCCVNYNKVHTLKKTYFVSVKMVIDYPKTQWCETIYMFMASMDWRFGDSLVNSWSLLCNVWGLSLKCQTVEGLAQPGFLGHLLLSLCGPLPVLLYHSHLQGSQTQNEELSRHAGSEF